MIWDSKCLFTEVNGMLFVCLCRTVSGWAGRVGSVVRLFGCSVLCFIGRISSTL